MKDNKYFVLSMILGWTLAIFFGATSINSRRDADRAEKENHIYRNYMGLKYQEVLIERGQYERYPEYYKLLTESDTSPKLRVGGYNAS